MKLWKYDIDNYARMQKKTKQKGKNAELEATFPEIEYPKEVKLMDELNKANEEKYKKWLYKKMLMEEILGKSTLIIGVRGKDGIVLGGDTKALRGGETDFENKVRTITPLEKTPIIFAGAGIVGVIDDFIEIFQKTLFDNIKAGKISSLLSIKMIAEDLVEKAEERYGPKVGEFPLHFILGGLSNLDTGEARLYEIGPGGFGQKIKYACLVGHGSRYARTIAKYLFPRDSRKGIIPFDCKEIVSRLAACIYWIREEIDNYVGGDPQVACILDNGSEIKDGTYNKMKILHTINKMKDALRNIKFEAKEKGKNKKKKPK
jgi:20S proteasome alpha/beta subunit